MLSQVTLKIVERFVAEGTLTRERFESARQQAEEANQRLDQVLLEEGLLTEEELLKAFSQELDISFQEDISQSEVPREYIERVPLQFARNHNLIGIERHNGQVKVATCEPLDLHPLDDVATILGAEVEPVFSTRHQILNLLDRVYHQDVREANDILEGVDDADLSRLDIEESEDLLDMANKAPIIKLVNTIIYQALKNRASDVHLQPYEDKLQVRYRIDGKLYDMMTPPKRFQEAIVSRIKVMARMDIAERRFPQDGRDTIRMGTREVDLRISTIPTYHGERVVMRLLDKSGGLLELEQIGMWPDDLELFDSLIHMAHGIIFITGPTGSGKTTTLYSAMARINSPDVNILTVEDPIEYQLRGISQMEVNEGKDLTFANAMRYFVRQDPDVIMVGEVRDKPTATIAIQSALTGHLVFSTLHTNDAPSSMTRLVDLGVEPYLVASSVNAIMAQRLLRRICPHCKEEYEVPDLEMRRTGVKPEDIPTGRMLRGRGCSECLNSGYSGRLGIFEVLVVNEQVREEVVAHVSATVIKKHAIERGMRTLRTDGIRKALKGLTTLEEVMRVTQMDVY
ncbi:MAG: type II secretion system ATPase GspE [Thermoleophilia bacterium]|nr:type II secretion system ATPase GspE [Thermoleophilia bacterium]